jgi:hypothetical protein
MVFACHRHKSLQSQYVAKIPRGKVMQLLVRLYGEGRGGCAIFLKVGEYGMILLLVLATAVISAVHPEKV